MMGVLSIQWSMTNFLDATIVVKGGNIVTKTFFKEADRNGYILN